MKKLTKYNRVAGYLLNIFRRANDRFFSGELPEPTITIQSTPGAYGHFCADGHLWQSKDGNSFEVNIGADTLNRPIELTITTLMHEMCHMYDHLNGIKDTSRGATYHNKHFKETAEERGLIVEYSKKYGFAHTKPGDILIEWILDEGFEEIQLTRTEEPYRPEAKEGEAGDDEAKGPETKSKSHSIKYTCPKCGCSVRATKKVNIACLDCSCPMFPPQEEC